MYVSTWIHVHKCTTYTGGANRDQNLTLDILDLELKELRHGVSAGKETQVNCKGTKIL